MFRSSILIALLSAAVCTSAFAQKIRQQRLTPEQVRVVAGLEKICILPPRVDVTRRIGNRTPDRMPGTFETDLAGRLTVELEREFAKKGFEICQRSPETPEALEPELTQIHDGLVAVVGASAGTHARTLAARLGADALVAVRYSGHLQSARSASDASECRGGSLGGIPVEIPLRLIMNGAFSGTPNYIGGNGVVRLVLIDGASGDILWAAQRAHRGIHDASRVTAMALKSMPARGKSMHLHEVESP